jgi:hypothetical protein
MSYAELPYAEEMDRVVLGTLCREPGPWGLDELTRVLGPGVDVEDAVNRLRRRGLVLRMEGGLIISSAAGRYAVAVEEATT